MTNSHNPLVVFLLTFIFSLLLITNVKSESFSFEFPDFDTDSESILVDGDANTTDGVLQLTKKDQLGKPFPHSVGLSVFFGVIHLSDKQSGKVADFTTEFSFVVNPKGSELHGDGFTFFIASVGFEFPENSTDGGFLGLFDKETAFNTSKNSIVAVEFDSFTNEWDPRYPENSPHIGIDINTIESSVVVPWTIDQQPEGSIGKAGITYGSNSKELSVIVTYENSPGKVETSTLSYPIDFANVLSEWVVIGFSGSTGEIAETHDILSWSFTSSL
ncbi:lectin 5-like [Cicer arietinum]|uniref:Agglutinin-2-like n=1 Tax=Cicer arietinum TaxID=3827 RepID=A0A1S2YZZ9_CICAR|nr:agglutinin-2-like [Cicer arietinum]